ncbi:MAG: HupE/UreJ family protein [Solirubrobacterales bacterium]
MAARPAVEMRAGLATILRRSFVAMLAVLVVAVVAAPASAHDTTSESILIKLNEGQAVVTASVPFAEIGYRDPSGDGLISPDELRAQEEQVSSTIVDTVRSNVSLSVAGNDLQIAGAGVPGLSETGAEESGSPNVALIFVAGPFDGDTGEVVLGWDFESPTSHVVLSYPDGLVTGELSDENTVTFSLGTWASVKSFFTQGIEHIRFGPDHLLFLLVLTLAVAGAAVNKSTAWQTVKLVTAFTVGHAISLCLAYFDVISVPAGVVEPVIALSIVVAAVLVIARRTDGGWIWIAGAIGLVHGLGFASSLSGLGLATSQHVASLAAFNVGIDVAQTAVVLAIIAALWLISKGLVDRMAWVQVPAAAIAALIAVVWTADRIFTGVA